MIEMTDRLMERFWATVSLPDNPSGCWEWRNAPNSQGRVYFFSNGKHRHAHRVSYEMFHGEIPQGLLVCHRCDNPKCVNPHHLFCGTYKDNSDDMVKKGRSAKGDRSAPRLYPGNYSGVKNSQAKLNPERVSEIRKLCADGVRREEIAKKFGIYVSTVYKIKMRQTWQNVA